MADGEEETVDGNVYQFFIGFTLTLDQMGTFHTILAKQSECVVLEQYFDVLCLTDTLLHNLGSTEERLAHNHIYFLGQSAQVKSVLAGCVTAAHYGDGLFTIEESVAGGTGRDSLSVIFTLIV